MHKSLLVPKPQGNQANGATIGVQSQRQRHTMASKLHVQSPLRSSKMKFQSKRRISVGLRMKKQDAKRESSSSSESRKIKSETTSKSSDINSLDHNHHQCSGGQTSENDSLNDFIPLVKGQLNQVIIDYLQNQIEPAKIFKKGTDPEQSEKLFKKYLNQLNSFHAASLIPIIDPFALSQPTPFKFHQDISCNGRVDIDSSSDLSDTDSACQDTPDDSVTEYNQQIGQQSVLVSQKTKELIGLSQQSHEKSLSSLRKFEGTNLSQLNLVEPNKIHKIMELLTDSKKNEIKRQIGQAFLDILKQTTVKCIIQKRVQRRSLWETQILTKLIMSQDVFKTQRILQDDDIRQIAKYLSYKELNEGDYIWEHGDHAENFYFILRGQVQLQEPNICTSLPNWKWAFNLYRSLKVWVSEHLNPKIKQQMQIELIKIKMSKNIQQLQGKSALQKPSKQQFAYIDHSVSPSKTNSPAHPFLSASPWSTKLQSNTNNHQQMIANKFANSLKKDYNKALVKVKFGQNLVKKFKNKKQQNKTTKVDKITRYWQCIKNDINISNAKKTRYDFDLDTFIKLTPQEKFNLQLLKILKNMTWFRPTNVVKIGQSIGHESLDWQGQLPEECKHITFQTNALCLNRACLAVLNQHCLSKIVRRINQDQEKNQIQMIQSIPYFQNFSVPKLKKVMKNSELKTFNKGQYVFQQGQITKYIFIIIDGQFDILYKTKNISYLQNTKDQVYSNQIKKTFQGDKRNRQSFTQGQIQNLQQQDRNVGINSILSFSDLLQAPVSPKNPKYCPYDMGFSSCPLQKNPQKLKKELPQTINVMKVGKDQVIGLINLYNSSTSTYSLICSSLCGGYVLCLPICDFSEVLQNQQSLNNEFKTYAVSEQSKIFQHVQNLNHAKFDKVDPSKIKDQIIKSTQNTNQNLNKIAPKRFNTEKTIEIDLKSKQQKNLDIQNVNATNVKNQKSDIIPSGFNNQSAQIQIVSQFHTLETPKTSSQIPENFQQEKIYDELLGIQAKTETTAVPQKASNLAISFQASQERISQAVDKKCKILITNQNADLYHQLEDLNYSQKKSVSQKFKRLGNASPSLNQLKSTFKSPQKKDNPINENYSTEQGADLSNLDSEKKHENKAILSITEFYRPRKQSNYVIQNRYSVYHNRQQKHGYLSQRAESQNKHSKRNRLTSPSFQISSIPEIQHQVVQQHQVVCLPPSSTTYSSQVMQNGLNGSMSAETPEQQCRATKGWTQSPFDQKVLIQSQNQNLLDLQYQYIESSLNDHKVTDVNQHSQQAKCQFQPPPTTSPKHNFSRITEGTSMAIGTIQQRKTRLMKRPLSIRKIETQLSPSTLSPTPPLKTSTPIKHQQSSSLNKMQQKWQKQCYNFISQKRDLILQTEADENAPHTPLPAATIGSITVKNNKPLSGINNFTVYRYDKVPHHLSQSTYHTSSRVVYQQQNLKTRHCTTQNTQNSIRSPISNPLNRQKTRNHLQNRTSDLLCKGEQPLAHDKQLMKHNIGAPMFSKSFQNCMVGGIGVCTFTAITPKQAVDMELLDRKKQTTTAPAGIQRPKIKKQQIMT